MGTQIIKIDRDVDRYMAWSSVIEAPLMIGTRKQMIKYLISDYAKGTDRRKREKEEAKQRLDRADKTGSSGYRPFGCTWDDSGEIFQQRGYLPRSAFAAFADILDADAARRGNGEWNMTKLPQQEWDALCDLMEPFEDEHDVRRTRR